MDGRRQPKTRSLVGRFKDTKPGDSSMEYLTWRDAELWIAPEDKGLERSPGRESSLKFVLMDIIPRADLMS